MDEPAAVLIDVHAVYADYINALIDGNRRMALKVAHESLAAGLSITSLYLHVLQPAMHEIGRLWEARQLSVADEHLATAITQAVMSQLYDAFCPRPPTGYTIVATSVGGELHELGIRMVADFFDLAGWKVYYLGANVPDSDIVRIVNERRADVLAVSVTLSKHLLQTRRVINAVRNSPIGARIKIIVGGQPFNRVPDLYQSLGADMTAVDAQQAVEEVTALVHTVAAA